MVAGEVAGHRRPAVLRSLARCIATGPSRGESRRSRRRTRAAKSHPIPVTICYSILGAPDDAAVGDLPAAAGVPSNCDNHRIDWQGHRRSRRGGCSLAWALALGLQLRPTGFADRLSPETVAGTTVVIRVSGRLFGGGHTVFPARVSGWLWPSGATHLHLVEHGFWGCGGHAPRGVSSSARSTRTRVVQVVAVMTLPTTLC